MDESGATINNTWKPSKYDLEEQNFLNPWSKYGKVTIFPLNILTSELKPSQVPFNALTYFVWYDFVSYKHLKVSKYHFICLRKKSTNMTHHFYLMYIMGYNINTATFNLNSKVTIQNVSNAGKQLSIKIIHRALGWKY